MLGASVHAVFVILVCLGMLAACRWAYHRSPMSGTIIAVGIAVRLASGLGLLAISYYHWPIFTSLQAGDGFWTVAPDARVYFEMAADAVRRQSLSMPFGSPSPVYAIALSAWLRAAGATVASAVLFNVATYVIAALAIVLLTGNQARWLGNMALFSFSFSPALLLTSTQVLKDPFFAMLVVMGCTAALLILRYSRQPLSEHGRLLAVGVLAALVAVAAIAGVRAYYAVFVWMAIASGLIVSFLTVQRRATFAAFAASVLVVLWCAFVVGADAYYVYYRDLIVRTTGLNVSLGALTSQRTDTSVPSRPPDIGELGATLNAVRLGFIGSGGGTNLSTRTGASSDSRAQRVMRDLAVGLAALFVPISALRATSIVTFNGGRGLLAITDVDTLFVDVTLLAVCVALFRAHALSRHNTGSVLFVVALAVISTLVVAYVVTNFGTMFRLRLLVTTPAWLAPLALWVEPAPGVEYTTSER